jgi:hypothetical protein
MQKTVSHVASTAARKNSRPQISGTSALLWDLRQCSPLCIKPEVSSRPDIRRGAIPFLSRLIFHFFTEYNTRRRRASGMLVASFEADIMRESSNQSV